MADDETKALAAGWYKCAGGEWTKIFKWAEGERQAAVNSATRALEYERELAGPNPRYGIRPAPRRPT